jgi:hypothetical protein
MQRSGNTGLGFALHLLDDSGYRRLNDESLGRVNLVLRHDDKNVEGLSYGVNVNAGMSKEEGLYPLGKFVDRRSQAG